MYILKRLSLILLLAGGIACQNFNLNLNNRPNPNYKSFKYYHSRSGLDEFSKLQTDGLYYKVGNDSLVSVFQFFANGFLVNIPTSYKSVGLQKRLISCWIPHVDSIQGVPKGCFKTNGDSIFFSTKSFDRTREFLYKGTYSENSLLLETNTKIKFLRNQKYVFFRIK